MTMTRRTVDWRVLILPALALAAVAGTTMSSMGGFRSGVPGIDPVSALREPSEAPLARQLGAVDEALTRRDPGRAIQAWRDAYGIALGSRRWEPMAAVGDAAVRIDAAAGRPSGYPTGFRAEARQAYLTALFRARAAGSQDGIERIATAFAGLGDADMAARARAIAAKR